MIWFLYNFGAIFGVVRALLTFPLAPFPPASWTLPFRHHILGEEMTRQGPDVCDYTFHTTKGAVTFRAWRYLSPRGADRLFNLARLGFYNSSPLHRILPGFVAQWGVAYHPSLAAVYDWRNDVSGRVLEQHSAPSLLSASNAGSESELHSGYTPKRHYKELLLVLFIILTHVHDECNSVGRADIYGQLLVLKPPSLAATPPPLPPRRRQYPPASSKPGLCMHTVLSEMSTAFLFLTRAFFLDTRLVRRSAHSRQIKRWQYDRWRW